MASTLDHLARLIAFPTVSRDSNRDLIAYIQAVLDDLGVRHFLAPSEDGAKANLFASFGPETSGGIVLSGHTDVVPVEDQAWSSDPFRLRRAEGRLYARGAVDMKGFIASCLALAPQAARRRLKRPLHFAFSYDEEVGCLGVRRLIAMLKEAPFRPSLCIVGEPTMMQTVTAHKGKDGARVTCHGLEVHSSLHPSGLNAMYMACDLVQAIRAEQQAIIRSGLKDGDYDVAHTTLHAGKMKGGETLNIVPNLASFEYEIRYLPGDDPRAIGARVQAAAAGIVAEARRVHPAADIRFTSGTAYPPLDTPVNSEAVKFVQALTGANGTAKICYGTEAGLFSAELGIASVVCGPGSIAVAHKPDEYVSEDQLALCDRFLARLLDTVTA